MLRLQDPVAAFGQVQRCLRFAQRGDGADQIGFGLDEVGRIDLKERIAFVHNAAQFGAEARDAARIRRENGRNLVVIEGDVMVVTFSP